MRLVFTKGQKVTGRGLYGIDVTGEFTGDVAMTEVAGRLYPTIRLACSENVCGVLAVTTLLDVYLETARSAE